MKLINCSSGPWGLSWKATLRKLKTHLAQAQHRMKQMADQHRTEREFQIGDWVYLRLQPYMQATVQFRSNMKLAPKFYGLTSLFQNPSIISCVLAQKEVGTWDTKLFLNPRCQQSLKLVPWSLYLWLCLIEGLWSTRDGLPLNFSSKIHLVFLFCCFVLLGRKVG